MKKNEDKIYEQWKSSTLLDTNGELSVIEEKKMALLFEAITNIYVLNEYNGYDAIMSNILITTFKRFYVRNLKVIYDTEFLDYFMEIFEGYIISNSIDVNLSYHELYNLSYNFNDYFNGINKTITKINDIMIGELNYYGK